MIPDAAMPRWKRTLLRWRARWFRFEDRLNDTAVWLGNRDLLAPALMVWTAWAVVFGSVVF